MRFFTAKVYIDNRELKDLGLDNNLFAIELRQDEFKSDIVTVDIWNEKLAFTDSDIFRERANLDVWLGDGSKLVYMGRFILQKPKYGFPEFDAPIIRLIGFDESSLLKQKGQRRRIFTFMTDSEIAIQIAGEYTLLNDIEITQERRDQESQIDETDIDFLARLAHRNGYILYVENKTLHFHQVRYEDHRLELVYGPEEENALFDFWPSKTLLNSAGVHLATVLDKNTGAILRAVSADIPDAIEMQDVRFSPNYKQPETTLVPRPNKYLKSVSGTESVTSLQNLVNRKQQRDSYLLSGWGKAQGNPDLKIRRVVNISGIGHLTGLYYLTSIIHKYEDGGYFTRFFGIKNRFGLLRSLPPSISGGQQPSNLTPGQEIQPNIIGEISQ